MSSQRGKNLEHRQKTCAGTSTFTLEHRHARPATPSSSTNLALEQRHHILEQTQVSLFQRKVVDVPARDRRCSSAQDVDVPMCQVVDVPEQKEINLWLFQRDYLSLFQRDYLSLFQRDYLSLFQRNTCRCSSVIIINFLPVTCGNWTRIFCMTKPLYREVTLSLFQRYM